MVIHDMRSPTNSIEFALKEGLKILNFNGKTNSNARKVIKYPTFLTK